MKTMFYEIMHRESCVAQLSTTGECRVCLEDFMPYDLVLVESDDFDERMMNILDYLVGNTDRHWENWGLLVDNETNQPIRLHDLMDFNRAFQQGVSAVRHARRRKLSDRGKTPSEPKRCCSGSGAEHRTEPSPSGGAHRILRASGMESNV